MISHFYLIQRVTILFAIISRCTAYRNLRRIEEMENNSINQHGDEREKDDIAKTLVVGGQDAPQGVFENIVCDVGSSHYCVCTMIAPDIALTAAHCYSNKDTVGDYVEIGKYHLTQYDAMDEKNIERIRIKDVRIIKCKNRWLCDLMLLKLEREYSKPLPIKLQLSKRKRRESNKLTIVGWGSTIPDDPSGYAEKLQQVEVNYVSNNNCKKYYKGISLESYFCAYLPGKDSCDGDSGGPIFRKKRTESGKIQYIQEGVTSFGSSTYGIAPGVYADLSYTPIKKFLHTNVCHKKKGLSPKSSYCRRGKLRNAI
jgi:secreted trypsin-like serine protease